MNTNEIRNLTEISDTVYDPNKKATEMLKDFDKEGFSIKIKSHYGKELEIEFNEGYAEHRPVVKKILEYVTSTYESRQTILKDMLLKEIKK